MLLLKADNTPIGNWTDWTRPKKAYQWQEGRSAMELAKAWFRGSTPTCPQELVVALELIAAVPRLTILEGRPEFVTPLPMAGEGRNHDLHLVATSQARPVTICVEAKADEPFGDTIAGTIAEARKRKASTGVPERARRLIKLLTGLDADPEAAPWATLRYQLLTGLAGTILQAALDKAAFAVFAVHEFRSTRTSETLHQRNSADLAAFLAAIAPARPPFDPGSAWGPHRTTDGTAIDLFVVKATTDRRNADSAT